MVRRYLEKMSGLSRAQVTRLIGQHLRGEEVKSRPYRRHRFPRRHTREDVAVLAAMDELHQSLSGPATQKLLQRAYYDFGEARCQRLAQLSVAQLYRLRQSRTYRELRVSYQPTRPTAVGLRPPPLPDGHRRQRVHQPHGGQTLKQVADRADQITSARHSNDNGLAEAKNGAVVRKHMGYTHIAAPHAAAMEAF